MVYSVYAALGIRLARSQHIIIEWTDREHRQTFALCDDCGIVDEKVRHGDEYENDVKNTRGDEPSGALHA
jgi:hypothetical protein